MVATSSTVAVSPKATASGQVLEQPAIPFRRWRFRFGCMHVLSTYFLLIAGGMVTSMDAGLAVPDWPTSYGNLWFVPMVGNVFYEHGHRLVAQFVGLLTIVYTVWIWRTESSRRMRWLAVGLLATVLAQGLLGGLTVIFLLPPAVSVAHGCLAQSFFCLTLATTYVLSAEYAASRPASRTGTGRVLQRACLLLAAAVFLQLLLGAAIRHSGAALAIPDFPRALGQWLPPLSDPRVAIHFAHRLGALLVAFSVIGVLFCAFRQRRLRASAMVLLLMVGSQIGLGAWTVLSGTAAAVATLHVVTGAAILALTLLLLLRSYRRRSMP